MSPAVAQTRTALISLAGNPNTGKTTLFNALCGTRQKTGNYPGVTVEKKIGSSLIGERQVEILDLPGIYSLKAVSPDEQTAADALMGRISGVKKTDLILFILDATNLKRNLLLFSQLAELNIPMVVALTMTDLLGKDGIELDTQGLESQLTVPVIPVNAKEEKSVAKLKEVLEENLIHSKRPRIDVPYPISVEKAVDELCHSLGRIAPISRFEARNLIFFSRDPVRHIFENSREALEAVERARTSIHGIQPSRITADRYSWAESVSKKIEKRQPRKTATFSQKIDRVLTHRVLGLASFFAIMYFVFRSIYSWAAPLMNAIESLFDFFSEKASTALDSYPMLSSLVSDGAIGGVGSVIVFLPQIIILFAFIAILEDSGYLARAAFLMDRLLSWTGLNGRAFIPMLSSFACAVPGVMATRVMPDARARMTAVLVSPLMSCSARLPVYLLMISSFIEPVYGPAWAAFTLFAMHGLGLLVALPVAFVINRGVLKTPDLPFILEMPPYRKPAFRNVLYRVFEASKKFLLRAGTVIFAMSIVIWALSYFPRPASTADRIRATHAAEVESAGKNDPRLLSSLENKIKREIASAYLEGSYLGRTGKFIQPVFAPLGYDWKITIGILSAFPAREVIISSLGIIYSVGDNGEEQDLRQRMSDEKREDGRPLFTPLLAISLMVFFALCCQCFSTVVTVQRELGSWPLATFMFFYMTGLAYVFSLIVFQAGKALGLS